MSADFSFIHKIEQKLAGVLPGWEAQLKMSPPYHESYRILTPDHKTACVMLLLFPKNGDWYISLIERSSHHPDDKHAGQISFPGGKLDETDPSLAACAIRETFEEIGVAQQSIHILGQLSPLFVFVSNFLVHPFVGYCREYPKFSIHTDEVQTLIEMPVWHFTDDGAKSVTDIRVRNVVLQNVPYYKVHDKMLWGATAMIMSEWEHILRLS